MRAKTQFVANVPPELDDLAEQVGEFIEYWGFKRVHGRIWTHLFLSEKPLDAGDLVKRLRISKALVSMSIADLLEYEVVLPSGRGPEGTQLYQANTNLSAVIFNVLRQRERKMINRVSTSFAALQARDSSSLEESGVDTVRLKELGDLVVGARGALEGFIWSDHLIGVTLKDGEKDATQALQERLRGISSFLGQTE